MNAESPFITPEKKRVAHNGPSVNNVNLIQELAYKRHMLSAALTTQNGKASVKRSTTSPYRPSSTSSILKRPKRNAILSSDEEMFSPEKNFQSTIKVDESNGSGYSRVHRLSSSDSDATTSRVEDDSDWLAKPRLGGVVPKGKQKSYPQPVKQKYLPRSRILSESDSENEVDNKDDITNKKSLKSAIKQARKNKRKNGKAFEDDLGLSSSDEEAEENNIDSFDSEDSDADDHLNKKATGLQKILQDRCLKSLNELSIEELVNIPRFNDKFSKFIIQKRPFESFCQAVDVMRAFPRGTVFLEQYLEFLENRSILDEVLDDCKRYSQNIQESLQNVQNTVMEQPKTLNPECKLHHYQQVGLNWLIMMDKLKLNAILADEMGLGKTVQVIAFLTYLKETNVKGTNLVVVPSSTIENWLKEIQKWSPFLKYMTYYGSQSDRAEFRAMASKQKDIDVILTTYNMICSKPEDRKFFKKFSLNYVIYDEGHMLRYLTIVVTSSLDLAIHSATPI